jgi:signal transduction histidine kinase
MTLTARLSVFFLTALAVVLAAFSTILYLLAYSYLHHQVDERLAAALDTLTAAGEIGPEGVVWEPAERRLSLGRDGVGGALQWRVAKADGHDIDRSPEAAAAFVFADAGPPTSPAARASWDASIQGLPWRFARERLAAGTPGGATPAVRHPPEPDEQRYPELVMTVGVPMTPVYATLRRLAGALAGVSVATWLTAAFVGRQVCRRALAPVTRMATAARLMHATDVDRRLPAPGTGDELDDLGVAFNGLLDRLHESLERQRQFTGDASHQLRTPLAALLGQIEVALRRERPPEEYQRVLTLVQGQAVRLHQVVNSLLFLARADAEARLPDLERLDLALWVRRHLSTWAGHVRAADLQLEGASDGPRWVAVQSPLLAQLVDNLIDNAGKYSDAGTPILVRLGIEGAFVRLTVEDAGCGIPVEDLPHVFKPFYRSAAARHRGLAGVGLGLSVAERIATAFGGRLSVQSGPGAGTRFTLRLPEA